LNNTLSRLNIWSEIIVHWGLGAFLLFVTHVKDLKDFNWLKKKPVW
jgi:hypothetical protein